MKKWLVNIGSLMIIAGLILNYKSEIVTLYQKAVNYLYKTETNLTKNEYYRDYNFEFVQNTTDFEPEKFQDILNIFYTVMNSGMDTFTFYCPNDYVNCASDVKALANDQSLLSHINNFVHPYNAFENIEIQYSSFGEVTITVDKSYTNQEITLVNNKIEEIYNNVIKESSSDIDKIKSVHDYIVTHSKYDSLRGDQNIVNYRSEIAYGPLIEGFGICGGYSDAMQLFLEKMGIKNFKVSSERHVWNAVYINGSWYHLDLTWDDPVTSNNSDVLDHGYFVITSGDLLSKEKTEHSYDDSIYLELR